MIIEKILNNNVVITIDPKTKKEKILMGSGLGFKKKVGQSIELEKIEKIFTINDKVVVNKFKNLVDQIPLEILECVDEIIKYAQLKLNKKLDQHVYLSLSDHLSFSIKRLKNNIKIKNSLLEEIRRVHKDEFEVGLWAVNCVNERMKVNLPIDEAGFVAFHVVNAMYNDNIKESMLMTSIVKDILNIIRYYFSVDFIFEDLNYDRLLTHLKCFAKRIIDNKQHSLESNSFIDLIKQNYAKEYGCSFKIKEYIDKKYNYFVNDDELVYLTMHIHRVIESNKLNN